MLNQSEKSHLMAALHYLYYFSLLLWFNPLISNYSFRDCDDVGSL